MKTGLVELSLTMRSSYKFSKDAKELYFVTFTIVEWIPLFTKSKYCDIVIKNLEFYRKNQGLKVHYLVIMPDHVHLILSSQNNLSDTVRNMKSYMARELIDNLKFDKRKWVLNSFKYYKKKSKLESQYQLWQEGSHPEMITFEKMLVQKIEYLHFNPVKIGLVREPEDWIYSSASYYADQDSIMDFDEIQL